MSAFGGRMDEQMLTDQIDDEYDVMNDETFGGEVPNDEWESEQAEALHTVPAAEQSLFDYAASRLPISVNEDPLDFLKESISHLVDDDDLPFMGEQKRSTGTRPPMDFFGPGSLQTPFFQLDKGTSIWSESPPTKSTSVPSAAAVSGLFERMRVNGAESIGLPVDPGPVLVKGAKTAEELEAEMLGKSASTSTAPPPSSSQPSGMKSCQDLEREMIESSRAAASEAKLPPGALNAVPGSQQLPSMPGVQMPQGAHMLRGMPPHPMLANPQVRAALMARWLAANPGTMPPVWFRLPPPPPIMPPPPGSGFRPAIMRPGGPQMNYNNVRVQQNDPRAIGFVVQQGGVRRGSPNFPKRRLFDSPGRQSNDSSYEDRRNRDYHRDRDRDRDYHHNRDPFADLMTRRERSWLIKIQTLQLYSENPYVDDYYWMMYRRRKADNNALVCKDTDHNDNFEHRAYVPPSFEGSLGKVQVLSANFPRQVLDLAAANGERQQSVDESSPRESPPANKIQATIGGRRLKNVLIEIENMYLIILEVLDLMFLQENSPDGTTEDQKEKAAARAKSLVESIVSTLLTEDRIVSALSVRKGRRLFIQLMLHCDQDDCLKFMQNILQCLYAISKKEPHLEISSAIKILIDSKLTGLKGTVWSSLWETIKIDILNNVVKYKLGNLILLHLIQRSALEGVKLSDGAVKVVEHWSNLFHSNIVMSNTDGHGRGTLEKDQLEVISAWLKNTSGASISESAIDAIEAYLVK